MTDYSNLEQHVKAVVALANGAAGDTDAENDETMKQERETDVPVDLAHQPVDIFGTSRLIGSPHCPLGLLPEVLETWALDVADRLGVDPSMVAMPMLAVCAAAIDDRVQIRPLLHDASWRESVRLWVAFVAESGEKKTPALKAALAPLYTIEREWTEQDHEKDLAYQAELAIVTEAQKVQQKQKAKAMASGKSLDAPELPEPPVKPPIRRKIVSDSTVEALAGVLVDNPWGLLEVHDELSSWFGGFDAYRKQHVNKDRALYLEAYNGGPQVIDRVSRGRSFVPNWSLSLVGGIQPEPMRRLAGQITDDGLIQRFIVVFTQRGGATIDRPANERVKAKYEQLVRALVTWDIGGPDEFRVCQLSAAAQVQRELLNMRVQQVRHMPWVSPAFHAHLSKWEGLFPRLCLLFHVVDHALDLPHLPDDIDEETAQRVAAFMLEYLLPHAARFYTELLQQSEAESNVQWIAGFILAHEMSVISTRDVGRAYRTLRGETKEIQLAMEHLTALSWVKPINDNLPGGARRWKVNEEVHRRFLVRAKEEKARRAAVIEQIQEAVRDFPQLEGSDA